MSATPDLTSRIELEKQEGYWPDKTLLGYFSATCEARPDDLAVVDVRAGADTATELSYAELASHAQTIANNLAARGIRQGDVVSFQLPNWWEFIAIHLACLKIGAVSNPLMPIFRQRELDFILRNAESKALVVPATFRNFDHQALGRHLLADVNTLEHLFVVGGDGPESFESTLLADSGASSSGHVPIGPNDLMQILYTSGTTGQPKGVMHNSNTLLTSAIEFAKFIEFERGDVVFMPSPLAHQTGFSFGIMMAMINDSTLVIMDTWSGKEGLRLIETYKIGYLFAATPFLADLTAAQEADNRDLSSFKQFITAGAPVPPPLVERALAALQTNLFTGWGMTEVGIATVTKPDGLKTSVSDGMAVPGGEVRVIDSEGALVAAGTEGRLQYRGSVTSLGYFKRDDLDIVDAEGWLETGDNATMDDEGYIRITGRSKDIIIRGGENIPVVEVENLSLGMSKIKEVALVAMPDDRLGEKGCIFVELAEGNTLDLAELCDHLNDQGIAKQYLPERLELVDEFPRTPSGKIQKFKLRELAKEFG